MTNLNDVKRPEASISLEFSRLMELTLTQVRQEAKAQIEAEEAQESGKKPGALKPLSFLKEKFIS